MPLTLETQIARLQTQAQDLWPGAVVAFDQRHGFLVRRGPTARKKKWQDWPWPEKDARLALSPCYRVAKEQRDEDHGRLCR